MSREARAWLEDMLAAAEAIRRFVQGCTFDAFAANEEKRSAIERQVFIIGEAAARMPQALRREDAPVPWHAVIRLRNILAHGYWTVEDEEIWQVATVHVPALAAYIRELLETL
jgi:uncharacterized protein with HEPN domain